jgi:hypothetical protein
VISCRRAGWIGACIPHGIHRLKLFITGDWSSCGVDEIHDFGAEREVGLFDFSCPLQVFPCDSRDDGAAAGDGPVVVDRAEVDREIQVLVEEPDLKVDHVALLVELVVHGEEREVPVLGLVSIRIEWQMLGGGGEDLPDEIPLGIPIGANLHTFSEFHAKHSHVHLGDWGFHMQTLLNFFEACDASHPHERHFVVVDC